MSSTEKELTPVEKLEAYKDRVKNSVNEILEKTLPEKILQLNALLESDKFNVARVATIHRGLEVEPLLAGSVLVPPPGRSAESGDATDGTTPSSGPGAGVNEITTKFLQWNLESMLKPPGGRVQCNAELVELFQLVSRMHFELLQQTAAIKTAIVYLMPKVEDGNNFGVEIQEETFKMIKELESDLNNVWKDSFYSDYCKDRARFAADICKDPYLEDNRHGLRQLDESAFYTLIYVVTFIRDAYGKIHDVITKNIDKIRKPRTSNAASLF